MLQMFFDLLWVGNHIESGGDGSGEVVRVWRRRRRVDVEAQSFLARGAGKYEVLRYFDQLKEALVGHEAADHRKVHTNLPSFTINLAEPLEFRRARSCRSTSGFNLSAKADGLGSAGGLNTDMDGSMKRRMWLGRNWMRGRNSGAG